MRVGDVIAGRATVDALHLNRPGVVNLCKVLIPVGEHPPVHDHE
jgi:hypothetical protein